MRNNGSKTQYVYHLQWLHINYQLQGYDGRSSLQYYCGYSSVHYSYTLLSYKERLQRLGLESLEMRRLRCDLLYTYKIVFGLTSEAAKNMFTFTSSLYSVNTRGHAYKLYPHNNRINVRKHFFCERVITPWNSLPAIAEDFCSLSSFKCFLNSTDLSMYVLRGFQI